MRVCYFILLPAVARAVTTTSVSGMSNPFTPLARLTDIAEHRKSGLVNGTMKGGEASDREERVLAVTLDFVHKVEVWLYNIKTKVLPTEKAALADQIWTKLKDKEHVEGLGRQYQNSNFGLTPEGALGRVLAEHVGDGAMAQALLRASHKKRKKREPHLEAVRDAMKAHWTAKKRTTNEILQWLGRDQPSSDKDLFDYGIAELLTGAHAEDKHVAEVLLEYFEGNSVRFLVALVRAEKKEGADESVMKVCWDWLRLKLPDYAVEHEAFRTLMDPAPEGDKWAEVEDHLFGWPSETEKKEIYEELTRRPVSGN